jgi:hypothetical protein
MRCRRSSGIRSAALITLAAGLTLAGCGFGSPAATPFSVSYPAATAGANPIPLTLVDQTGLVTSVVAVAGGAASTGVEVAPAVGSALRVGWQGGPCDDRVTLVLNDIGSSYELAIHNHPPITAGLTCDDSIVTRAVDITFNRHLDPSQLTLNVTYP